MPFTDDVVEQHLSGRIDAGPYPRETPAAQPVDELWH
jgi:hypothetical protein